MPSGDKQIQDVYHRPNLERARKGRLPLVTVVMYYTVLYCTVLYCTGPYIAIQSHDVSMSIITAIIL